MKSYKKKNSYKKGGKKRNVYAKGSQMPSPYAANFIGFNPNEDTSQSIFSNYITPNRSLNQPNIHQYDPRMSNDPNYGLYNPWSLDTTSQYTMGQDMLYNPQGGGESGMLTNPWTQNTWKTQANEQLMSDAGVGNFSTNTELPDSTLAQNTSKVGKGVGQATNYVGTVTQAIDDFSNADSSAETMEGVKNVIRDVPVVGQFSEAGRGLTEGTGALAGEIASAFGSTDKEAQEITDITKVFTDPSQIATYYIDQDLEEDRRRQEAKNKLTAYAKYGGIVNSYQAGDNMPVQNIKEVEANPFLPFNEYYDYYDGGQKELEDIINRFGRDVFHRDKDTSIGVPDPNDPKYDTITGGDDRMNDHIFGRQHIIANKIYDKLGITDLAKDSFARRHQAENWDALMKRTPNKQSQAEWLEQYNRTALNPQELAHILKYEKEHTRDDGTVDWKDFTFSMKEDYGAGPENRDFWGMFLPWPEKQQTRNIPTTNVSSIPPYNIDSNYAETQQKIKENQAEAAKIPSMSYKMQTVIHPSGKKSFRQVPYSIGTEGMSVPGAVYTDYTQQQWQENMPNLTQNVGKPGLIQSADQKSQILKNLETGQYGYDNLHLFDTKQTPWVKPKEVETNIETNASFNYGGNMFNNYAGGGNMFNNDGFGVNTMNQIPVNEFRAGGTHEENPLGGIPQGIGPNGAPNLVEEGELKIPDPRDPSGNSSFIVSAQKDMKITKAIAEKYNLKKHIGKTLLETANAVLRKNDLFPREGDTIKQNSIDQELIAFMNAHEELTAMKEAKESAKFQEKLGDLAEEFPQQMDAMMQPPQEAMTQQGMPQGIPMGMPPMGMPIAKYGGNIHQYNPNLVKKAKEANPNLKKNIKLDSTVYINPGTFSKKDLEKLKKKDKKQFGGNIHQVDSNMRNVYQGPLTEADVTSLDQMYATTVDPEIPFAPTTRPNYRSILSDEEAQKNEAFRRRAFENYARSGSGDVNFYAQKGDPSVGYRGYSDDMMREAMKYANIDLDSEEGRRLRARDEQDIIDYKGFFNMYGGNIHQINSHMRNKGDGIYIYDDKRYKRQNGKWFKEIKADSGNFVPLTKGDVKKRSAVLDKEAQLSLHSFPLHLQVFDEKGMPIQGAQIDTSGYSSDTAGGLRTDELYPMFLKDRGTISPAMTSQKLHQYDIDYILRQKLDEDEGTKDKPISIFRDEWEKYRKGPYRPTSTLPLKNGGNIHQYNPNMANATSAFLSTASPTALDVYGNIINMSPQEQIDLNKSLAKEQKQMQEGINLLLNPFSDTPESSFDYTKLNDPRFGGTVDYNELYTPSKIFDAQEMPAKEGGEGGEEKDLVTEEQRQIEELKKQNKDLQQLIKDYKKLNRLESKDPENTKTIENKRSIMDQIAKGLPVLSNLAMGLFGKSATLDLPNVSDITLDRFNPNETLKKVKRSYAAARKATKDLRSNPGAYFASRQALANREAESIANVMDQFNRMNTQVDMREKGLNRQGELANIQNLMRSQQYGDMASAAQTNMLLEGVKQLGQIGASNESNKLAKLYNQMYAPDYNVEDTWSWFGRYGGKIKKNKK